MCRDRDLWGLDWIGKNRKIETAGPPMPMDGPAAIVRLLVDFLGHVAACHIRHTHA